MTLDRPTLQVYNRYLSTRRKILDTIMGVVKNWLGAHATILVVALVVAALWGSSLVGLFLQVRRDVSSLTDGDPVKPDTVYMEPEAVDAAIREAKRGPTLVERITTKEIQADTVYIARTDTVMEELPPFGIQIVEKSGRTLRVDALSRDGKETQTHKFTLPLPDSDYTLRSGKRPVILRAGRNLSLFDWTGEAALYVGTAGWRGHVLGPIAVRPTTNLRVTPAAVVDRDGVELGAALVYDF